MSLGTEVGLNPDDIVLGGDPASPWKGAQQPPPHFSAHFALARSPISATAELLLTLLLQTHMNFTTLCYNTPGHAISRQKIH